MDTRWDRLFADVAAGVDAQARAELDAQVADRVRAERATLTLAERITGGGPVRLQLLGGWWVEGSAVAAGADWVRLQPLDARRDYLVRLGAVIEVSGLGPGARRLPAGPAGTPTLAAILRRLAADRLRVRVDDVTGRARVGTVEAVGKDHLDLAEHPADVPPRRGEIVRRVVLPVAAVAGVGRGRA